MPLLLLIVPLPPAYQALIREHYHVVQMAAADIASDHPACRRAQVVWTNGMVGLNAAAMAALPELGIIVCQGVGYDAVDVAAAAERGITVAAGQGVNSTTVADHAVALLLSLLRRTPAYDRQVRAGHWLDVRELDPVLTGKRVGILGFGRIGQLIAQRVAGFDCEIVYHSRREVAGSGHAYAATPRALAERSDVLVLCCPGGAATHHLVDAQVLDALGCSGHLVNVARGSVVDTEALRAALVERRIAGAALDVIEGEPGVPDAWQTLTNVIFTPHTGGLSAPAFDEMVRQGLASLDAFFSNATTTVPGRVPG